MSNAGKPAVLVVDPRMTSFATEIAEIFDLIDAADTRRVAREADRIIAILCSGSQIVDARLMDLLPRLRMVVTPTAGMSGIDLGAARARGIIVTNGGDTHSEEVADTALTLTLAARLRLLSQDRLVREGEWQAGVPVPRRSLSTEQVGIVGMGNIGQAVARKIAPFCPDIRWWAPRLQDLPWPRMESLIGLARWSSILILCARGDLANTKLIGRPVIEALGAEGLFVNIARGFMVDEDALIAALKSGALGQAALDVFEEEPTPTDRWRHVPNTLLTPHIGGMTSKAVEALQKLVAYNLGCLVTGNAPKHAVVS